MQAVMSLALGINLSGGPGGFGDAADEPPPALALAHKAKGNEAYKKRDFDAALKHYDDAIAADPGDVTYRNNKCAVHFEKKDYDSVLTEGREAIKVGREHRADYELVHKIYVRMD